MIDSPSRRVHSFVTPHLALTSTGLSHCSSQQVAAFPTIVTPFHLLLFQPSELDTVTIRALNAEFMTFMTLVAYILRKHGA